MIPRGPLVVLSIVGLTDFASAFFFGFASPPPGECLPSTEIFRRMARQMGFNQPELYATDEELIEALLDTDHPSVKGITLGRLREEGWLRLSYDNPTIAYPLGFATPSAKIEFYSARARDDGHDALPGYTPALEASSAELKARFPLQLISPASHYFLNSMFANKPELQAKAGPTTVTLHPDDAHARGLHGGSTVRISNDRGAFVARLEVADRVLRGVAVVPKGHWPKLVPGFANANSTVAERDTDMGWGAVFHDNLVEVSACDAGGATRHSDRTQERADECN